VLFDRSPVARVPADIAPAVAVLSLDISSLVPQVERAVLAAHSARRTAGASERPLSVYVQGLGKSGLAACAAIRQLVAAGRLGDGVVRILGTDAAPAAVKTEAARALANVTGVVDGKDSLSTISFLEEHGLPDGADLVLATHNQAGCETSAVMATRARGTCIFFSMATVFSQANLATDAAGKDVSCHFGVGLADAQDEAMYTLLRADPVLRSHFEGLAAELSAALDAAAEIT
jgi:L-erythro-3,5-diaminohexanoate dehydrogenase